MEAGEVVATIPRRCLVLASDARNTVVIVSGRERAIDGAVLAWRRKYAK